MKLQINTNKIEDLKPCQDRLDNWLKHYESFDLFSGNYVNI